MGNLPVGDRMERVAMDILEPGTITARGNRYILVIVDCFTRWTEAYAIQDHTAQTVADVFITEFVTRFGMPSKIHSDQGREFESKLFIEVVELLGGEKTRTCPYRPQGDGMVERFNRTVLAMLSAVVADDQEDWDDHLPYVLAAYRSAVHESTGCTPNMMMLGREAATPLDLMYEIQGPETEARVPQCSVAYVEWIRSATIAAHEMARKHMAAAMCTKNGTTTINQPDDYFRPEVGYYITTHPRGDQKWDADGRDHI